MAEILLSNVLEAEDARLSRCFDATQLLFVRQGFLKAARLKRLLETWLATCDTVCVLNAAWLAIVLPGLDDDSGREAAESLVDVFEGKQPVVVCSLPHLRLRQMGTGPLLDLVQKELSAILKEEAPDKRRQTMRPKGLVATNGRTCGGPDDPENGDTRFCTPLVLDIAGGLPEDEARVSVEEKNFLFA